MTAPFPYFGGKRKIAPVVWGLLGADVANYVEPFFGSGAVLLARPGWDPGARWIETVNDKDGLVCNFWRAVQADPEAVAQWADWPSNENDLHARHVWLRERTGDLSRRLEGDPDFCDAKIAGWWVWGMSQWIGGGWCTANGKGPWAVTEEDGVRRLERVGDGVERQLVHLGNAGHGVSRKLVHLGNAGQGVSRQLVHLGDAGQGVCDYETAGIGNEGLLNWMVALAERLRRVRVCSGDWSRVCGTTPTVKLGTTGVFLDPPYGTAAARVEGIYGEDSLDVAGDVLNWCAERGDDPRLRVVLCGYRGEHDRLEELGWSAIPWKAHGGYGSQGTGKTNGRANAEREVLWASPHCLKDRCTREEAPALQLDCAGM